MADFDLVNDVTLLHRRNQGMIKLAADKARAASSACTCLPDHPDTLIGLGVMIMANEMTLTQVAQAAFPHPAQTELFGELARRLLNRLRRTAKK